MFDTERIEKYRKIHNITQSEFAKNIGITTKTYQNLLKSKDFRVSHLEKMAEYFRVSITDFFGEEVSEEEWFEMNSGPEIWEEMKKSEKKEYSALLKLVNFIEWLDIADTDKVKKVIEARLKINIEVKPGIKISDLQKYFATFKRKADIPQSIYHCIDVEKYMQSDLSKDFTRGENQDFIHYINDLIKEKEKNSSS